MSIVNGQTLFDAVGEEPGPVADNHEVMASSRVRLLKFMTLFGVGGTEKQVVNLVREMDHSRFDLSFGCLKRWGGMLDDISSQQIDVTEYPVRNLYGYNALLQQYKFATSLRKRKIQIVHSYNFYANVFSLPAARFAGVPCRVASIRDMGIYLTPAQQKVQKWACRLADKIVVNADAIRDWLVNQGYRPEKIVTIRNGLDIAKYRRNSGGRKIRQELDLPPDAPVVLMLSRLNPQKGIEYFLAAIAQVRQNFPDAYFLVVGDEFTREGDVRKPDLEYRKKLQETATRFGAGNHIRFTGMRSDVPEILAAASVSVLPSFSEGISNTVLESMAAGVPMVATHVGGTPEVIQDQQHGLLVAPGNAPALAEAICAILENPLLARRLSEQAKLRVETGFSLDRMVRETQNLYACLLERKSGEMSGIAGG
ncbi:MAG: glycosyltransferase [Gammaproteobacteria bacterium]